MGPPHDIIKVKSSNHYLSLLNREDDFRVRYMDSNHTVVTSDGVAPDEELSAPQLVCGHLK